MSTTTGVVMEVGLMDTFRAYPAIATGDDRDSDSDNAHGSISSLGSRIATVAHHRGYRCTHAGA